MVKSSDILGLNSRQQLYKALNSKLSRKISNSKLRTKRTLEQAGVDVPKLYAKFSELDQVRDFDFGKINSSFVIKPSGGSGGKGILIIRKPIPDKNAWLGVDGSEYSASDLVLHISDILDGQYSTFGSKHFAFVEERVPIHPKFKKMVVNGTPDIRVIVYNCVPVVAMLRLPTKESEGRANLHQGAIGVGVDIATGVTLKGVRKRKPIRFVPGTKRKLNGVKIPSWSAILRTAVEASMASGLQFGGVDILLHREKGPMVVELNASPGLDIQLANATGLKRRLERVEGLKIRNVDHGVRVGKALFAETFADKVKADEGLVILDTFEEIKVKNREGNKVVVPAVMDTGLYRSQIERELADKLGLLDEKHMLWERKRGKVTQKVIEVTFYLRSKKIVAGCSVVSSIRKKEKMAIGRLDLDGYLVQPILKGS